MGILVFWFLTKKKEKKKEGSESHEVLRYLVQSRIFHLEHLETSRTFQPSFYSYILSWIMIFHELNIFPTRTKPKHPPHSPGYLISWNFMKKLHSKLFEKQNELKDKKVRNNSDFFWSKKFIFGTALFVNRYGLFYKLSDKSCSFKNGKSGDELSSQSRKFKMQIQTFQNSWIFMKLKNI